MPRIKPHQIVLAVGVGFGLFTAASGVVPSIVEWHDDSEVSREVFGNVPTPLKVVLYATLAVGFALVGWLSSMRVRNWERGRPDNRRTTPRNAKRRAEHYRAGTWMATLLRDPVAGVMHSFIYFGFLVLFVVTVVLEINHQVPESLKFLHGDVYRGYALVGDVFGVVFLTGIVWAIVRRYVQRPYRIRIKTKPEDALILGTFLTIGVTGFVVEALRIALVGRPEFEKFAVVGWALAGVVDGWAHGTLQDLHRWLWGVHFAGFVLFLVILPTTKLRHMFTSPMNMYLRDKERPKGAMKPMPNLMETELESFGASVIEDFTWKQLMDTDACTICGRCTSVCPAHATGKPLDPREIVTKIGQVMSESRPAGAVSSVVGHEPELTVSTPCPSNSSR